MGHNFDTSSVKNMVNMFKETAPWHHMVIRLGRAFSVEKVEIAAGLLDRPGVGWCRLIVSDKNVYDWLLDPINYVNAEYSVELETLVENRVRRGQHETYKINRNIKRNIL